jgi:tRNA pseudouridine38-40 synthase
MAAAAGDLLGEHDFTSYRAVACQAQSPVREVHELQVSRRGDLIMLSIRANAFLHHMVRNIAGVLMAIGRGAEEVGWARRVLEARDRTLGGVTAPPDGLYLVAVDYPEEFGLPRQRPQPWQFYPGEGGVETGGPSV